MLKTSARVHPFSISRKWLDRFYEYSTLVCNCNSLATSTSQVKDWVPCTCTRARHTISLHLGNGKAPFLVRRLRRLTGSNYLGRSPRLLSPRSSLGLGLAQGTCREANEHDMIGKKDVRCLLWAERKLEREPGTLLRPWDQCTGDVPGDWEGGGAPSCC